MTGTTVLIADDHPLFRRGVREAIEETGRYHVVAEAGDGETAPEHIEFLKPAFAIIDLAMPRLDGFQVVERAVEAGLETRMIVMTVFDQMEYLHKAVDVGASGFLVREDAQDELVGCIETVAAGEFYLSPAIGTPSPPDPMPSDDEDGAARIGLLTPQQCEVLRHLAQYKTSKEIARLLDPSPRAVDNRRFNMA